MKPIVLRMNTFMKKDDFKEYKEKWENENPGTLVIPCSMEVENKRTVKARNIWQSVYGHCEFKCSLCGADILIVEGGSLDGGYFNYCPNCGVELEEEKR